MTRRRASCIATMGVFLAFGCANGVAQTGGDAVFEQTSTETPVAESVRVPEKAAVPNEADIPDEVDASQPAAASDSSPAVDSGTNAVDAGCSTAVTGLGGIGVPPGSTVTASRSYESTPAQAVDGNRDTFWNGGDFFATLVIQFPTPQALTGIRIAAGATPASSETYTIYGYKGTQGKRIGTLTAPVAMGYTVVPAISVLSDTYDRIVIDVAAAASWALIYDVSILTTACP